MARPQMQNAAATIATPTANACITLGGVIMVAEHGTVVNLHQILMLVQQLLF